MWVSFPLLLEPDLQGSRAQETGQQPRPNHHPLTSRASTTTSQATTRGGGERRGRRTSPPRMYLWGRNEGRCTHASSQLTPEHARHPDVSQRHSQRSVLRTTLEHQEVSHSPVSLPPSPTSCTKNKLFLVQRPRGSWGPWPAMVSPFPEAVAPTQEACAALPPAQLQGLKVRGSTRIWAGRLPALLPQNPLVAGTWHTAGRAAISLSRGLGALNIPQVSHWDTGGDPGAL